MNQLYLYIFFLFCLVIELCLFVTTWTVACQAPLSIGFSRQEYWSGLPFLSPANLPDPEIKPLYPALQVNFLPLSHLGSPTYRYIPILLDLLFIQVITVN